jgi:hypothetical protein
MELVELHSGHCACRGGSWVVQAGGCPSPRCLGPNGETPSGSVVLALDQWRALGRPGDAEAFGAALQRIKERHGRPRHELSLKVRIRRLDARGKLLDEEITATENLAEGGMTIPTGLPLHKGDAVVIEEEGGPFRSRAEVLETLHREVGVARASLRFTDPRAASHVRRILNTRRQQMP